MLHQLALKLCHAAVSAAEGRGNKVTVVVLDETFNVAASVRMDSAYASAFVLARAKAFTALNFRTSSADMSARVKEVNRITISTIEPNLLFIGGGEPIVMEGEIRGALGVSGGSEADDTEIAKAAIAAIEAD